MNAKQHYDHHLGNFYSWMVGDFHVRQSEQEIFFKQNNIRPFRTGIAVDLGCGHGLQAISLANLGFQVEAVDFNSQLIEELRQNAGKLTIRSHLKDLLEFIQGFTNSADVITCMGDTITHLSDRASIEALIKAASKKLVYGGKLIISFRDLTEELKEEQRFFLVQSDDDRLHTGFLEYFPDHVKVYDILNCKVQGQWRQTVSWYPKLRINQNEMKSLLTKHLFDIVHSDIHNRMIYLIAEKVKSI